MSNIKSGFCGIIGRPNVGKSTLMNQLIGQKIAITSNKPQTTRNKIQTVYTDDRGQVVFLDTPGMTKPKNKLGNYMEGVANSAMKDVDVLLWLVEPSDHIGNKDAAIVEKLEKINLPVILVINKVDMVKPEEVIESINVFKDVYNFAEIVPISAYKGDNCDELIDVIYKYLPYGELFYDEDTVTDQPMRQIVAEVIREKALYALSDEVPHGIAVAIDVMKERGTSNFFDIEATIICEKESHKGIIIGKGGSMIKRIGSDARYEIEHMMEARINLKLFVKVKENWRDSDYLIKNFGYKED